MSLVPINILAYLAILTLLAFIGVVAWGAMTVLQIVNEAKGKVGIINPPKQAVMQIISVGKGIAQRLIHRGKTIAGHAKRAGASVTGVKDDVVTVYKSIDIEGAKESAQEAAESVRHSGTVDAMAFAKQVADTLLQAQAAQKRGA